MTYPHRASRIVGTLAATILITLLSCGTPAPPDIPRQPITTTSAPDLTVRGVVVTGVEAGCLLLRTASETYLLIGGDPAVLMPDRQVVVQGRPRPDLATTCQQGTPLDVHTARSVT